MKTTLLNDRSIVSTIAGSSQRGASEYQRKPRLWAYPPPKAAPKGPSFREILERELGLVTSPASGKSNAPQANAESRADAETIQFLSGYWA